MPLHPNMTPGDFLEVFARRKWLIIFSLLFVMFGASVYCVVTPELYRSSTTIMVVPQRVPENYVRTTVTSRIEDRLSSIRQQVLSRTRLIAVMDELSLFREERKTVPLDKVVEEMRKRISIEVRQNEAFSLSFVHGDRQVAMLTTSRLAAFFIEENLKSREQQAVGTADFLESQLQETKKQLEVQEERVKRYKSLHMNELPQQLQANLQILSRLQDQQRSNNEILRSARDRRSFLESQVDALRTQNAIMERSEGSAGPGTTVELAAANPADPAASVIAELNTRQSQLANLSSRYTEDYPEIRRLKEDISRLEKRIRVLREGSVEAPPPPRGGRSASTSPAQEAARHVPARETDEQRRYREAREQLKKNEVEIRSLEAEKEQIRKSIAGMDARIEKAPEREQEMISLTRDYENLKRSYDELLRKKLDADVAQELEKRQKGEQFQILDPANLPQDPFIPNRPKVFGVGAVLALLVGFGGAIGLEMSDSRVRNKREFQQYSKLAVLASIPSINDRAYNRTLAVRRAAVYGGLIVFTASVTAFLILYGDRVRTILKGSM